jgi:hypothetical protein
MNYLRPLKHWDRGFETHSNAWMSVCLYSMFVLSCVWVAALLRAAHSSESYRLCKKDYRTEEVTTAQQKALEPWMNENEYILMM